MNSTVRLFLRLLAFALLALGMGVSVSAWTIHDAAHSMAQISVDQHHHHNEDGSVSIHDHSDDEAPDGGHDHMPSVLLGSIAMLDDVGFALIAPDFARIGFTIASSNGIERYPSNGLRRPPRLG
jgi:hypothetical protein